MPLTANAELGRYVDQELRLYPVRGGAHIFKGAFVGLHRASGYVRPLVAGDAFAGIAYEEVDNSAGEDGDKSVRLFTQGDFELPLSGAQNTTVGRPVYVSDDQTLNFVNTTGLTQMGKYVAPISANVGIVRIRTFADARTLRFANVAILSSTLGTTVNPILITHKPILIYSAEIIFNTKPDQGTLDVGTGNTVPNEIVNAFNLASLTNNQRALLPLASNTVAKDLRIWASVTAASSTAGVGGLLALRYIEMP